MMTYRLSGMIYYNGIHFTGICINKDGLSWGYDGLARGGRPERLRSVNLTAQRDYAGCDIHIVIYCLDSPTQSL